MSKFIIIFIFCFLWSTSSFGDDIAALKDMITVLESKMSSMNVEMMYLKERVEELEKVDPSAKGPAKTIMLTRTDNLPLIKPNVFNPDISVIGDVVYRTTNEYNAELDNDFLFREVEIVASANVDTFARGDIVLAVETESGATKIELEEGYLTLLETPLPSLQARFGKFRPYFGKANRMHLHALPWTTYPLAIRNYFGEEGFSDTGVSLSYLIENPWDIYSEITAEAFNNSARVFGGGATGETVYLGHWKNFFDINDNTSLELGGSFMFGDNGNEGSSKTRTTGADITLNTKLFGDYLKTISQTEFLLNKREQPDNDIDSWGMFTSLEQQIARRWWVFGRYDYSQLPAIADTDVHAYSAGLTFAQSEYAYWRVMFTRTDNDVSQDANEVWLQLDFGIGPHRPHTYR